MQLLDSWGDTRVTSGGNAGVYERWDESQPQGQKGYQGYAPRQNVSRAPGLWQHLKNLLPGPAFSEADGKKNRECQKSCGWSSTGVVVHENVDHARPHARGP